MSALAYVPPGTPGFPKGAVVSGSRDATVLVWDVEAATPVQILQGHQYQVCAGSERGGALPTGSATPAAAWTTGLAAEQSACLPSPLP